MIQQASCSSTDILLIEDEDDMPIVELMKKRALQRLNRPASPYTSVLNQTKHRKAPSAKKPPSVLSGSRRSKPSTPILSDNDMLLYSPMTYSDRYPVCTQIKEALYAIPSSTNFKDKVLQAMHHVENGLQILNKIAADDNTLENVLLYNLIQRIEYAMTDAIDQHS